MNSASELLWSRASVQLFDISFRHRPIYVSLAESGPEIGFEMFDGITELPPPRDMALCPRSVW